MSKIAEIKKMVGMGGMSLDKSTVVESNKQFSGEGQYGHWTLQTIVVIDDGIEKMRVVFENLPEFPKDIEGKTIEIVPTMNAKQNIMMGTKVKVRVDKENKELIELHVSKSAIVKIGGASVIEDAQIVDKNQTPNPHPSPEPPKPVDFVKDMMICIKEASVIMQEPEMVEIGKKISALGWKLEDLIDVALTLFINKQKRQY